WFAPLGYLIPAVLRASIAVGTLMACLEAVSLQLRQSEERYRLLTETARDAILAIDGAGMLLYANEAGLRTFGLSADTLKGRAFADLLPESERRYVETARQQCLSGTSSTYLHEIRMLATGGRVVPMEASCSLLRVPGGPPAILLVARDISERQEEQRFLSNLMASLPGMVYRCIDDEEWTLTYASAGTAELLGLDAADLADGGGITHASLIAPADRRRVEDEVHASIREGRTFEIEFRLANRQGGEKWVRERGRALDTGDGHHSLQGFISDVSESRRLTEQLRQAQKMEEIGRLAGGIAHDFNNLLTAVTAYGHFLKQALPPQHEAQKDVSGLLAAVERAAQLTKQLLAFSRRQSLEARPVNLNELVTNMGQLMRRLIGEDIEISVITDDRLRSIEGDPGQLEQALVNLVVNARDAMPGGGRLLIETAQITFSEEDAAANSAIHAGDYAVLAVSDSGIGMTQDVKDHLFEPFFTTKETGRGTGLGLAMVYSIVQQHHGDIRTYSEAGHGTTFKLYLPSLRGESRGATQPSPVADLPRGPETILIAEDEASVRDLLSRMLTDLGYTVLEASDGSEAMRIASEHRGNIELLLSDLVMPLMGGQKLDGLIRQARPGLRTLFISGYTDSTVLQRGLLGPDSAFLQKPFSARALAIAVRRLLDRETATPPPRHPPGPLGQR
ncbi:MAG: hybrid sensor histidine kinase/response regulator, partial [Anaerolineae bacterium]